MLRRRARRRRGGSACRGRIRPHGRRRIERLGPGAPFERITELFQRTTQFNATGRRFTPAELAGLAADPRPMCSRST
jgi:hypothetical protein